MRVAEIIVDISVDSLDRPFEYLIPEDLADEVREGTPVVIPFGRGNRELRGYVIRIKDDSNWDPSKLKSILSIHRGHVPATGQLLSLAAWKGRFWCNMVCPVGTVLGCLARISLLKPKIDPAKCVKCRICERVCKAQSIDVARGVIDLTTCVACFDCGAVCKKGALRWAR